MADEVRRSLGPLKVLAELSDEPWRFDFFAAARAIQAAHPDRPRLGASEWIGEDPVRFKQEPTMAFQASGVVGFGRREGEGPYELSTVFFGVFGPNGALPHHITERAIAAALQKKERTLPDFVDIFHHRLLSLLYRGWERGQIAVSRDRPGEDVYARYLNALFGAAPDEFRDRDALPDDTRRYLAGWFASRPPSAAGIAAILETVTGERVELAEFVGEWLPVGPDQHSALGLGAVTLGQDTLIGDRQYSLQSRIRMRLGPMSLARYRALLPTGALFPMVRDAMRSYLGLAWGWELQLVLRATEKPPLRLDASCALGWDGWLGEDESFADADDLRLDGGAPVAGTAGSR